MGIRARSQHMRPLTQTEKTGSPYQSMLDNPPGCSFVEAQILPLRAHVFDVPNFLEILLYPGEFLEDRMLLGINAIES